jgi:hypothetical protein
MLVVSPPRIKGGDSFVRARTPAIIHEVGKPLGTVAAMMGGSRRSKNA